MRALTLRWLLGLRENYWFWPTVLTTIAVALGLLMPSIDRWLGTEWMREAGWTRAMQVDGARSMLTTLAGSVLGVAGTAFSITIVAVSFASGNFGPRLIGNFMRDRTNQVVLGVFLATFTYCIVLMRSIHAATGEGGEEALAAFVPQVGLILALVMMLGSIGALIYFIHHIPESINVMNLAARIGQELREAITDALDRREAEADGRAPREDAEHAHADLAPARRREDEPDPPDARAIAATLDGYVLRYDLETMDEIAREHGLTLRVVEQPGSFVVRGADVIVGWPAASIEDDTADALARCVVVGEGRTGVQDVLFMSDELVEMIARALSPGVNDPQTAITCLDWMQMALTEFAARCPGSAVDERSGGKGKAGGAGLRLEHVTFEVMLSRSFGRMRQYVASDRNVTLHALDVLARLALVSRHAARRAHVLDEMGRLAASARELLSESAAREEVARTLSVARRRVAAHVRRSGRGDTRRQGGDARTQEALEGEGTGREGLGEKASKSVTATGDPERPDGRPVDALDASDAFAAARRPPPERSGARRRDLARADERLSTREDQAEG